MKLAIALYLTLVISIIFVPLSLQHLLTIPILVLSLLYGAIEIKIRKINNISFNRLKASSFLILAAFLPLAIYLLLGEWQYNTDLHLNADLCLTFFYYLCFVSFPEELFFRHVLLKKVNKKSYLMMVSALLFGLLHFRQGIEMVIFLTCFGLLYAFLRMQRLSLFWLILSHSIYNTVVTKIIPTSGALSAQYPFIFIGSFILLFCICLLSLSQLMLTRNKVYHY